MLRTTLSFAARRFLALVVCSITDVLSLQTCRSRGPHLQQKNKQYLGRKRSIPRESNAQKKMPIGRMPVSDSFARSLALLCSPRWYNSKNKACFNACASGIWTRPTKAGASKAASDGNWM